jgi:hypothetical protein
MNLLSALRCLLSKWLLSQNLSHTQCCDRSQVSVLHSWREAIYFTHVFVLLLGGFRGVAWLQPHLFITDVSFLSCGWKKGVVADDHRLVEEG